MSNDPAGLVFLAGTALFGAVAAVTSYVQRALAAPARKVRVVLERRKQARLDHARDGECSKIVGTVLAAGDELVAPLSGRRCVAYEVVLESKEIGREVGWDPFFRETRAVDFLLRDADADAAARVAMLRADLALVLDFVQETAAGHTPPPVIAAFVSQHTPSALLRGLQLRAREGVLEVGERASAFGVLGTERTADGTEGGYRTAPARRFIAPRRRSEKVLVSDEKSTIAH